MKYKNNIKVQAEEIYPERPRKIDDLNYLVESMRAESKQFERDFKAFDKSKIPREFLILCWQYKESMELLLEGYGMAVDSFYPNTKVGRPENIDAKEIALKVIKKFQESVGNPDILPTARELHKGIGDEITKLIFQKQKAPAEVTLRTCSSWLTQIKRGNFKTKDDDSW